MARLDCDCKRTDGVTLVECYLASDAAEDVRVDIAHDGPVWPPRRQGVPEAGWDEDGWTGAVAPDDPVALGYATPTEVGDRPVRLADETPADAADVTDPTPRELVRTLGDARPPRDAVPGATGATDSGASTPDRTVATGGSSPTDRPREPAQDRSPTSFDAAAERVERAERLASVSSVPAATEAVREAGGIEAVRALAEQLAADRKRLVTHAERSGRLAERAAAVEIPVETLDRVT